MIEAVHTSETSVHLYETIRRYIPKDCHIHSPAVKSKKSKAVPLYATETLEGSGCIAPTHSWPRHQIRCVVSVTPRPLFTPGERTPGTHWTGSWVGPRAGLDPKATGKILSPLHGIEPRSPGRPVRSQTLHWLSYAGSYVTTWNITNYQRQQTEPYVMDFLCRSFSPRNWSVKSLVRCFKGTHFQYRIVSYQFALSTDAGICFDPLWRL
jgi:hypothetical protein